MSNKDKREQVAAALRERGIRLSVCACGCCGGPTVSVEVDGVLLVDEEDYFNIDMISKEEDDTN